MATPTRARLRRLLASSADRSVTYPAIGATLDGVVPAGFRAAEHSRHSPAAAWDPARRAIVGWAGHRHAGMILEPESPALVVGTDVAMAVGIGGVWTTAVCRIVGVVDEPDRFGFAYGTLPHHPVSGEEIFLASRTSTGVRFELRSFSRPNVWFTRRAGPIGRRLQAIVSRRYLAGFDVASRH